MRIIIATALAAASVVVGVTTSVVGSASAAPATALPDTARSAALPAGELAGVACQTDRSCLAVGANAVGTPDSAALAESWNGTAWHSVAVKLPTGATGGQFDGVTCPGTSGTDCVAVGSFAPKGYPPGYAAAFTDTWNGRAWAPVQVTTGVITSLYSVSCLSAKSCVAVGHEHAPEGGYGAGIAYRWNGATWVGGQIPDPAGDYDSEFNGVSCVAGSFCAAVGYGKAEGTNQTQTFIYLWHGTTWKTVTPTLPKGVTNLVLNSVSCTSPRSCVAVGNGSGTLGTATVAEVWDGKAWAATRPIAWPASAANSWVDGVSCVTASYCVAAGYIDQNPQAKGFNTGRAAASVWNGRTWTAAAVAAPGKDKASLFTGVTCLRKSFCVAAGQVGPYDSTKGTGLSGFWNGTSWRLVG